MVWFSEPVPLATVGTGERLETVLDVEFPVTDAVPEDAAELVTGGGASVFGWSPSPPAVRVGAGVVAGGGSCLRTGSNRPATARLKQRKRHRSAQSCRVCGIIVGVRAPEGAVQASSERRIRGCPSGGDEDGARPAPHQETSNMAQYKTEDGSDLLNPSKAPRAWEGRGGGRSKHIRQVSY